MYEIKKYPDGTSYAVVHPTKEFTFKVNNYEDLWHLNQVVDALNYQGIRPTITIPNLIDAQADRRFNSNESSGLKLVCKFLNSMNADFKIFHPHNPEIIEALIDNVEILENSDFIACILPSVLTPKGVRDSGNLHGNTILMSSDAGGYKPLVKLCDKLKWRGEIYSASKSRSPETGKITQFIDRQDFGGKDILIVDDICVFGGTFKGLSKMLKERNCGKLYLAVSHMTVQNLGEDPVTSYFDKVFVVNSKFNTYFFRHGENMTVEYLIFDNLEVINIFE